MKAPIAKKVTCEITQHGFSRNDEYAWLRDKNWKRFIDGDLTFADPDVKAYIDAENSYKDSIMAENKETEKALYNEILSRTKEDKQSYAFKKGGYYYYAREEQGLNYPLLCRKEALADGSMSVVEQIYFDINVEADGKELYSFRYSAVNRSNTFFAYMYNLTGSMGGTLKVWDLATGKELGFSVEDTTGHFLWASNEWIYYVEQDDSSRGKDVYKINIHQGISSRQLVFSKPDKYKDMFLAISETTDRSYLTIDLRSGSSQVLYVSKTGSEHFDEFIVGQHDITYELDHYNEQFYIKTNDFGAGDFCVMCCPVDQSRWRKKHWRELLGQTSGCSINAIHIYNTYLILERQNNNKALPELAVYNLNGESTATDLNVIAMPEQVYALSFIGAWEFQDSKVCFIFETPLSAESTYELDLKSLSLTLRHHESTPNFDSANYELKREMAKARDGELVPVTIIHKKGMKLDGSHPAFVYGYGSYGADMPAYFNASRFSLIDRGFVFCISHIRGGGDKGFDWYLNGKMRHKINSFNDFIDCCEHLISSGYSSAGNMAIHGGSAGGLLMGAVTNMRPDLFKAVIADVAFVDLVNTISDETLPLTPPEWEEWGNPIESRGDFEYMMSYSPYDNIERKAYPNMLYNSGISDEQVTYWEPTKMVAKLREYKTDKRLLLLNMKMYAGHAGASKKYEFIEERAFSYSFILKSFGVHHSRSY